MDISNPRRILAVSLEDSIQHLSRVVQDLTGSVPEPSSTSLAGSTHDLQLKTPYYTASVPIWLDLIASPAEWTSSFLSEEAKEVLAVLGGLVLVFAIPGPNPSAYTGDNEAPNLIRLIGKVVQQGLGGWEWDGVRLAIGVGEGDVEEWDELCADAGLEFIQLGGAQQERNEFGEKTGIPRVREALESNDWAQVDDPSFSDLDETQSNELDGGDDDDFDPESLDFGVDRADFEGLRLAIWEASHGNNEGDTQDDNIAKPKPTPQPANTLGSEAVDAKETSSESKPNQRDTEDGDLEDEDVAKVERMMRKLQAARELGEGMSETQRKRLAAKAVEDVMRDL